MPEACACAGIGACPPGAEPEAGADTGAEAEAASRVDADGEAKNFALAAEALVGADLEARVGSEPSADLEAEAGAEVEANLEDLRDENAEVTRLLTRL